MLDLLTFDPQGLWQALLLELEHVVSPAWWHANIDGLLKVFIIDITLAGDNAIVVGMAASQVPKEQRGKVIFWGISAAVILRILFAAVTQKLLLIVGLTLAGGILLLYVCWKMYRQIRGGEEHDLDQAAAANGNSNAHLSFWAAVTQIIIADVSMSLDNVLAVAGAAGESTLVLVLGLALSIILMAVASHFIARLLVRYPWIAWVGFIIILWVALDMIYRGSHEVTCQAMGFGCSEDLLKAIMHRLGIGG